MYKGAEEISKISAAQREDGWWEVNHTVRQRRSEDLKDWEEKEIHASAIAETLPRAQADCMLTIITYLQSVDGNLFLDKTLGRVMEEE